MEKSRIELYELVWTKPMTHLSKELGLSDVGLRKICVKFGIPLPQRGYVKCVRSKMNITVSLDFGSPLPKQSVLLH